MSTPPTPLASLSPDGLRKRAPRRLILAALFAVALLPPPAHGVAHIFPPPIPPQSPGTDPNVAFRLEMAASRLVHRKTEAAKKLLNPVHGDPKAKYLAGQLAIYLVARHPQRPAIVGPFSRAVTTHNIFLFLRGRGLSVTQTRSWADESLKAYDRVIAVPKHDDRPFARLARVALLAELGRRDEALRTLAGLPPDAIDEADRYQLLAYVQSALGRKERALANLRKAIRLNGPSLVAWLRVSDDFFRLKADPAFRTLLRGASPPK